MANKKSNQIELKVEKNKKGKKGITFSSVAVLLIAALVYFSPLGNSLKSSTDEVTTTQEAVTFDYEEVTEAKTEASSAKEEISFYFEKITEAKTKAKQYTSTYSTYKTTSYYSTEPSYTYKFRNQDRLEEHFEKHGREVGASSASEYEKMAAEVVTSSKALHKTEAEDGDDVYYIKSTGEFVIVSTDGYIRTYYIADYDYFNRQ